MIKNAPDVMTVKEVMKVLRCGRTKIMEFIHNGVLEAHYVCGKAVELQEALNYIKEKYGDDDYLRKVVDRLWKL